MYGNELKAGFTLVGYQINKVMPELLADVVRHAAGAILGFRNIRGLAQREKKRIPVGKQKDY